MNTLLFLLVLLIISSQTYISYITFLLCMIHLVLCILLLGNSYLALIYLMIYIGSIAILFIYILMVLSIVSVYSYGYLLFSILLIFITTLGIVIPNNYFMEFNLLTYSYNLYSSILIPISLILFISMIFAIRYI